MDIYLNLGKIWMNRGRDVRQDRRSTQDLLSFKIHNYVDRFVSQENGNALENPLKCGTDHKTIVDLEYRKDHITAVFFRLSDFNMKRFSFAYVIDSENPPI